jgi:hypothetical protein
LRPERWESGSSVFFNHPVHFIGVFFHFADEVQLGAAAVQIVARMMDPIISSSRRGLNMVYLVLAKETKSHVQAQKQGYSKNTI